jgi:putative redox protein
MIIRARHADAYVFELASDAHNALSDQSPAYGGQGLGPMPSEYLLWSIAACFGQSLLFVAGKMRKPLEGLTLEVRADKDKTEQRFGTITIVVGSAGPPAQLEKIMHTAKRYCFVTNSLSVPIQYIVEETSTLP